MSQFNKPLFTYVDGQLDNSATSIFTHSPLTVISKDAKLNFNQANLGYIPDCGTSYYLSRLPGELGLYLALTGESLSGQDIIKTGFASRFLEQREYIVQNILKAHRLWDSDSTSQEIFGDALSQQIEQRVNNRYQFYRKVKEEIEILINSEDSLFSKDNNWNRANVAKLLYQIHLTNYQNQDNQILSRQNGHQELVNQLYDYEKFMFKVLEDKGFSSVYSQELYKYPMEQLSKCFGGRTMEEIFENLRKDNTEWSQNVLEILQKRSPLVLKLTLRLIREAEKSTFAECLNRQYRVALRRTRDSQFKSNLTQVLVEKKQLGKSKKALKEISADEVERYFRPLSQDLQIPEFRENSQNQQILPSQHYYRDLPNNIRSYLNQQNVVDLNQRKTFEFDVKSFLYSIGIDGRSMHLQPEPIAKLISQKLLIDAENKRVFNNAVFLSRSESLIEAFFEDRAKKIQELFATSEQNLQEKTNKIISKIFEERLEARLEKVRQNSQLINQEKQIKMLLDIRKHIIEKRLTNIEDSSLNNQPPQHLPIFFPKDNTQNLLETPNPQVASTFEALIQNVNIQQIDTDNQLGVRSSILSVTEQKPVADFVSNEQPIDRASYFTNENTRIVAKKLKFAARFGDMLGSEKKGYYTELVQSVGEQSIHIHNFIQQNGGGQEQVIEFLTNEGITTLRQVSQEYVLRLKNSVANTNFKQELEQKNVILNAVQQEMNKADQMISFLDLNPESKLNSINSYTQKDENYVNSFKKFLSRDHKLLQILKPVLQKNEQSPVCEGIRQKFASILLNIYQKKVSSILEKENQTNKSIIPLLTSDSKQPSPLIESGPIKIVDAYIQQSLEYDINNYVSSHVMFSLGMIGLVELQQLFKKLHNFSQVANSMFSSREQQLDDQGIPEDGAPVKQNSVDSLDDATLVNLQKYLQQLGLEISKLEDFEDMIEYLNQLTANFALLYVSYKDNLIFTEDQVVELVNKIQLSKQMQFEELSFVNYVLTSFEQHQRYNREIRARTQGDLADTIDSNPFKIDIPKTLSANFNSVKDDIQNYQKDVKQTIFKIEQNEDSKTLISGYYTYVVKLDALINYAIYGEDSVTIKRHIFSSNINIFFFLNQYSFLSIRNRQFIPELFQQQNKDLSQVFKKLHTIDNRVNQSEWINIKAFSLNNFVPFHSQLYKVLKEIMDKRFSLEKNLSYNQLIALDLEIQNILKPQNLRDLVTELSLLKLVMNELQNDVALIREIQYQAERGEKPIQTEQQTNNSTQINQESINKLLAFVVMLENKYSQASQNEVQISSKQQKEDKGIFDRLLKESSNPPKLKQNVSQEYAERLYMELLGYENYLADSKSEKTRQFQEFKIIKENSLQKELLLSLEQIHKDPIIKINPTLTDEIETIIKQLQTENIY